MSENETNAQSVSDVISDINATIAEAPETEDANIIGSKTAGRKGGKKEGSLAPDDNGIFISGEKSPKPKKAASPKSNKPKNETVAIYSERNVNWRDVGKISKGYNIVSTEAAKKWLTRSYIREATPEEVAREFGV